MGKICWQKSTGENNSFVYTDILHGDGGDAGVLRVADGAAVGVKNAGFASITGTGVVLADGSKLNAFENVHFEKIGKTPLTMDMNLAGDLEGITGNELGSAWIRLTGSSVSEDQTWKNFGLSYFIGENSEIMGALEIEAGTTVLMEPGIRISVRDEGALKTLGTAESKVVIKSSKSSPKAGDREYIEIASSASNDSFFEHTNILHGGGSANYGALHVKDGATVAVRDVRFESIKDIGAVVEAGAALEAFSNVHFEKIDKVPLQIDMDLAGKLEGITGADLETSRIELIGNVVKTDQTWKKFEIPYFIGEYADITKTLEIAAGTTVLMGPGLRLSVNDGGTLKAHGTDASRIIIKSSKPGPGEGDWDYIEIKASASKDSLFTYTTISHGGGGGKGAVYLESGARVEFDHVVFEENKTCDVSKSGTVMDIENESTFGRCSQ